MVDKLFVVATNTVKKLVSKADLRKALSNETERFLRKGGEVTEIPRGISGKEPGDGPLIPNKGLFIEPKTSRTLVPEVIAAIEERRTQRQVPKPAPKASRSRKPRHKVIYDDFGEPLRKVWVED